MRALLAALRRAAVALPLLLGATAWAPPALGETDVERDLRLIVFALQENLQRAEQELAQLRERTRQAEARLAGSEGAPEAEALARLRGEVEEARLTFAKQLHLLNAKLEEGRVSYTIFESDHLRKVAAANLAAIYAVLTISVLVVVAGVGFTGYQLWHVVKEGGPQPTQELEASAQRFRLTTSFVGVTVLTISFLFLYLFASAFYQPARPPEPREAAGSAAAAGNGAGQPPRGP